MYPIPEVDWDVPREIMSDIPFSVDEVASWLTNNPITTSHDVYLERSKESFEIFDSTSHANLYRVYPNKLFCDHQIKGRCVTQIDDITMLARKIRAPNWVGPIFATHAPSDSIRLDGSTT